MLITHSENCTIYLIADDYCILNTITVSVVLFIITCLFNAGVIQLFVESPIFYFIAVT